MKLVRCVIYVQLDSIFQEKAEETPDKESKKVKTDDFSSDAKTSDGKKWNLKIVSWNVDGLRAWLKVISS